MGSAPSRFTVTIPGHGVFSFTGDALDLVMSRHLPASPDVLRARVSAVAEEIDYSDVHDVASFLAILADWKQGSLDNARPIPSAEPASPPRYGDRGDYERGWRASQRFARSTSYQVLSPLERADERGEPTAWYLGYEDHAADRTKWASFAPATAAVHLDMPKGGRACTAPTYLPHTERPDAVTCATCLLMLDLWRTSRRTCAACVRGDAAGHQH